MSRAQCCPDTSENTARACLCPSAQDSSHEAECVKVSAVPRMTPMLLHRLWENGTNTYGDLGFVFRFSLDCGEILKILQGGVGMCRQITGASGQERAWRRGGAGAGCVKGASLLARAWRPLPHHPTFRLPFIYLARRMKDEPRETKAEGRGETVRN